MNISAPPPPPNLAPTFDGNVISEIEIEVTKGIDGELVDSTPYEYVSPTVTDPEEN